MGALSIVWTVALLAFNPNQDVLGDTISALGFAVCFYYGFTGLACAVYFRRDLFKSARNFFLAGLIPVLGGIMMAYVAVKAYGYYNTAGNNYSKPIIGIQTPIFVGIGGLILGVILMFASWPFFPQFFRRKWWQSRRPGGARGGRHPRQGRADSGRASRERPRRARIPLARPSPVARARSRRPHLTVRFLARTASECHRCEVM